MGWLISPDSIYSLLLVQWVGCGSFAVMYSMNVETPTFHVSKSDEGYFLEDSMLTYVDRIGTPC